MESHAAAFVSVTPCTHSLSASSRPVAAPAASTFLLPSAFTPRRAKLLRSDSDPRLSAARSAERPRSTTLNAVNAAETRASSVDTPAASSIDSYLYAKKLIVEEALKTAVQSNSPQTHKICQSMSYSLLAGGKRIRPILVMAAFEMFNPGAPVDPAIPTAVAVEMIHTMSLIHDDLPCMDNDDFRRGKPTNHKVFGENIAILAGDAMLSGAFEFVAKNTKGVDPQRVVHVLALLGESVGPEGLAGGQVMDLENEGNPDVDLDTLYWIHKHKTAALLRVSVAAGAILGGASDKDVERVSEFAVKIGLAFQIADDVLDVTRSSEELGKTAGKDQAVNKATYPRLLGLEESIRQAKKLADEAKALLEPYGDHSKPLLALADFIIERNN